MANSPTWRAYARDQEDYMELVWPPTARQWFRNEMTVARRDQFNEGGNTGKASTATGASTASPANTSSRTSNQTSRTDGNGNAAAAAAPSLALALSLVVLAARA